MKSQSVGVPYALYNKSPLAKCAEEWITFTAALTSSASPILTSNNKVRALHPSSPSLSPSPHHSLGLTALKCFLDSKALCKEKVSSYPLADLCLKGRILIIHHPDKKQAHRVIHLLAGLQVTALHHGIQFFPPRVGLLLGQALWTVKGQLSQIALPLGQRELLAAHFHYTKFQLNHRPRTIMGRHKKRPTKHSEFLDFI